MTSMIEIKRDDGTTLGKYRAPPGGKPVSEVLDSVFMKHGLVGVLVDDDSMDLTKSDLLSAGTYTFHPSINVPPPGLRPANAAELPSAGAGQATPEQDDRLQRLLEGFVKMMTERFEVVARKKSYRISEANSTVFQEIQSSGGVEEIDSVEVLFDARKHNLRNVPIFKWGNGVESGQAVRYVKYVKQHLVQSNQKWSVINGNQHPRLLDGNVRGNGEGTVFKGTTDVVVVEKAAEDLPETGLKIIFELKKDGTIDKRAEYQTIVSLLLANNTCRRLRPVAVLTDLGNMWKFFYCDHSTVYRHTFPSSKEAVGYLDAILKDDIEQDDSHDTSALRSPGESSLRGVKRSFSGQRKFSTPALEQLEELAGFLPEDELRQGRAAIALQCALNIPAFYSVVSDLRESPEGMCLRGR